MMKQTIRNLLLLTAMIIAGAGQVWAIVPTYGTISYTQGENDGGTLTFFTSDDLTEQSIIVFNDLTGKSSSMNQSTIYIMATPDAIHTLGEDASFITVEKTQAANNINAPRRTPEVGDYCEVTAVAGKTGVYQFTMPNDESINVSVTVTFPSKQTASVSYIKADGTQGTQTAYILDGTETELGLADKEETWYVCNTSLTYTNGLATKCDVHLILADGKTMTISADHKVESETVPGFAIEGLNKLTIYAQSEGDNAGILDYSNCSYGVSLNNRLTINGGNIKGTILSSTDNIEINGGNICIESQIDNPSIWCHYNITINGGTVVAANDGNSAIHSNGDIVINGGKVTADATGDFAYGIRGKSIVLGWTNADDFIYASSYKLNEPDKAPRRTAGPGDEYTIFTADGQRFVAYTPATETVSEAATSIISGETGPDYIDGMVLRPLDGYCVNFDSRVGISAKDEVDFSITNQNATFNYFVFAEGDKVTLKYTKPENGSDLVWLYSITDAGNHNITLNADHSFTMPASDILYPTVLDITVSEIGNGSYNGKSQQPTSIPYTYDYAGNNNGSMTVSETSSDYTVTAIYPQTDVDGNDQPIYSTESIDEAVNAGKYKLSISANGVYFGTTDVEYTIGRKRLFLPIIALQNYVKEANNKVYYNYTGQAIKPEVEVTYVDYDNDRENVTINPDNYTVNYTNNLNSGEATVRIQAKTTGNYYSEYPDYDYKHFYILDPANVSCGGSMKYSFYSADTDTDNDQVTDIPAGTLILTGEGQISETPWTGYKATLEEDASNAVKTVTINMTGAKIDIPAGAFAGAFAGLQEEEKNIKLNFTGTKPTGGEFVVKLNGTPLIPDDENEPEKFTIPVASLVATGDATDVLFATCVVTEQAPKKGNSNENENFMGYTPTSGNMKLTGNAKAWIMTSCDFANGQVGISEVEAGEIPEGSVVLLSNVNEGTALPNRITLQSTEGVSDETASIMQNALPNFVASTGVETAEQLVAKVMTPKVGKAPELESINLLDYMGFKLKDGAFRGVDLKGGKTVSKGLVVLITNYLDVLLKKAFGTSHAPQFTIPIDLGDGEMTVIDEHELRNSNGLSRDGWYTVDGRKLDKQPTAKGLYIRNGRKVVIK